MGQREGEGVKERVSKRGRGCQNEAEGVKERERALKGGRAIGSKRGRGRQGEGDKER